MEAVKKMEELEKDTLELVLKEILQEQQHAKKIIDDQVAAINQLTTTVNSFTQRLENFKIISPPIGTKPIEEIIKNGISEIQSMTENIPKNVTRKFQILLFPEQDAKLFYKIVFGRWFMWLTIMLFISSLYKWSIHWSDNQKEIKEQQSQTDKIKKAWDYFYFQEGKVVRRLMDSAYIKSQKQD
jgi:hypothetical protein